MKHAKWLLLVAVGILMVLPGCKSMNPMVKPDVRIALYTQELGSWPLMTGGKEPQTQIGTVSMYWQYDYFDPALYDPTDPTNNDAFVNLALVVKCETYSPDYPITDANLNISDTMPTRKGQPGHYNFNKYLVTRIPNPSDRYTAIFVVPVAALETVPWECGDWLWFLVHVAAGGETAYPGEFVPKTPGYTAWFNRLHVECINPEPRPGEDPEETAWGYNLGAILYHFDNWGVTKWGGAIPYTLGRGPVVVDLWAGAAHNMSPPGLDVGSVTVTDDVNGITGKVYVTYTLDPGVMLSATHAGAAVDMPTLRDNSKGFAPGKLGVTHEFDPWVPGDIINLTYDPAWGTNFVVAAHAVVQIPVPAGEMTAD